MSPADPSVCPLCRAPLATPALPQDAGTGTATASPDHSAPVTPQGVPARIGRFEVRRLLGEGSFGRVYEAHDPVMKRVVALKVAKHLDERHAQRFLREARAAGLLTHPNIVAVYDSGSDGPHRYIASAFVEGQTLPGEKMEPRQAAEVVKKLAEALGYAHRMGVVHRDVKPGNVMLRGDGEPLLMDFGLAARADEEGKLTVAGQFMGTPAYAAPEQWRGEAAAGSDQYALGCLLFELLTGGPPFRGGSTEHYLFLHTQAPVPDMPGVPLDLQTIARKCLEKEPARRYASCGELAEDLGRFLRGDPTKARPVGPVERLWRWANREPVTAGLVSAVVVLLLVGSSLVTWQWFRAVDALEQARLEQREKVLAQVDALRQAAPEAVPAILETLGQNQEQVLPRLREAYEEEKDEQRRMRLALALLPLEAEEVRGPLLEWMLQTRDPAEVLLIRDALAPHAEGLAEGLWKRQGLRPRVALAKFAPKDARWKGEAQGVVRDLLADPFHQNAWMRGLRPVRQALVPALAAVFRDKKAGERRQAAALVLADYAADDANTLAELLLDAEPEQYRVLRFALVKHREKILARMDAEVGKLPDYWKDGPIAWPAADAALVKEVGAAGGMVSERFALCQALPLERVGAVTQGLRRAGYRPVRVRPHEGGVAVVWTRDGRAWKLTLGLTAQQVEKALEKGFVPADVAAYRTKDGDRHALLWAEPRKGEEAVAYAGVPAEEHKARTDVPKGRGFVPATVQGLLGADGVVRYCGVWRKWPGQAKDWNLAWNDHLITHDDRCFAGQRLLLDVSGHVPAKEGPPARGALTPIGKFARKAVLDGSWGAVAEALTGPRDQSWFVEVARERVLAARVEGARQVGLLLNRLPITRGAIEKHLAAAEELLQEAVHRGATEAPTWAGDEDFAALKGRPGFTRLTAAQPAGAKLRYASTWAGVKDREASGLHGLSPEAHLGRCRQLAAQGWRPVGLSLAGGLAASVWHRPRLSAPQIEAASRREGVAAATLLNLRRPDPVWPLLRHRADPTAQSFFTALAAPLGADVKHLLARLEVETDAGARRNLVLALGEYGEKDLPAATRGQLVKKLLSWYRDDADPGVHGAIGWLLGHGKEGPAARALDWGQAGQLRRIERELAGAWRESAVLPRRVWYINGQGQTYVVVRGPSEFRMGSPPWEKERAEDRDEKPHRRVVPHTFALAAAPVTVREWEEFLKENPGIRHGYTKRYAPEPDCPIVSVTMYEGMAYCNWLSRKEGIPRGQWCYPDKIEEGMKLPADLLKRKGYRLPMEAEWEMAARAGTLSSRSFGEGEFLLGRHAWYRENAQDRTWPVGQKRPNAWGLYDMHGNVWAWCHDPGYYPRPDCRQSTYIYSSTIEERLSRVLRGGSFIIEAPSVRSAFRFNLRPANRFDILGLRPCRTYD